MMALSRAYAPMFPEFDAFLFASVGEEVDGVPLSVLSVLARLNLEPRDEAARLAHLTREAAAEQLARMIARLSDRWSVSEARRIASGLIERLPMAAVAGNSARAATGARPATGFWASGLLIYLAVAMAIVVGLIAGGYFSLGS